MPSVIFRETGLHVCLEKKKTQTKNQTTKSPLWKVLGNLKSLTWLEFVEWKSLTKEIQTLQGKKTQLKHTTKKPYTSTSTKSRTPQSGP